MRFSKETHIFIPVPSLLIEKALHNFSFLCFTTRPTNTLKVDDAIIYYQGSWNGFQTLP